MQNRSKSLLVIGECLLELTYSDTNSFNRSFAGDTYNSAIYAKRWSPSLEVFFFSAIGKDLISKGMLSEWQSQGLNCSLILTAHDSKPGIYTISLDSQGERSFDYWRDRSAATKMIKLLHEQDNNSFLFGHSIAYVSGISLAILSEDDKYNLINILVQLQKTGTKIAYDPNYRPRMWHSAAHARSWNDRMYEIADLAFPGVEDHQLLYGHTDHQSINTYLTGYEVAEVCIKCDEDGVFTYLDGDLHHQENYCPAPSQIDSTAAGDSFAGTYLAARIEGDEINQAVRNAMAVAREVVQHSGAIMSKEHYTRFQRGLK